MSDEIVYDNVKDILEAILERATRDLFILSETDPDFKTAYSLIFDDNYRIYFDGLDEYGQQFERGTTLSLDEILQFFEEINKEYMRWQIKKRMLNDRHNVAIKLFGPIKEDK